MPLHVHQRMFANISVIRNIQHGDPTLLRDEADYEQAR